MYSSFLRRVASHRAVAIPFAIATAAAIALQPSAIAQPPKIAPLSNSKANVYAGELSIAGVTLSSTEDDIYWALGSPKSREISSGFVILYYGGMSVSLRDGYVWDIIATSPKYCTPSGICPGDSVSRVFNMFGPTDIIGQRAVYTASGMGGCVLDLSIAYDTVSQIQLICQ